MPAASRFWASAAESAAVYSGRDEHQLVPESEIVVGRDIADDLGGRMGGQLVAAAPRGHGPADVPEAARFALDVTRLPGVKTAALDDVAGVVAEDADALGQHGEVRLVSLVPVELAPAALPRLTVHQDASAARQSVHASRRNTAKIPARQTIPIFSDRLSCSDSAKKQRISLLLYLERRRFIPFSE